MKVIAAQPKLVAQVHQAIVPEIAQGKLPPGSRIIQERLAQELGVSRQPVQQALLLLRNQGVLTDAPGRGQIVAPLDLDHVRNMYDIRAVMEGLAFRRAAERSAGQARRLGPKLIEQGRAAVASGDLSEMLHAGSSRDIWSQHEAMLGAVAQGDAERAASLAQEHILEAGAVVIDRLTLERQATKGPWV